MFDNITKGKFNSREKILKEDRFDHEVSVSPCWIANVRGDSFDQAKQNAEFICFCFNLQQKYDIGLFEETVSQLQKILDYWDSGNFTREKTMWDRTRSILTEVKQTKK